MTTTNQHYTVSRADVTSQADDDVSNDDDRFFFSRRHPLIQFRFHFENQHPTNFESNR